MFTLYYGSVERLGIILDSYYVRDDVKLLLTILFFLKYPPIVAVMVVAEFESQHRNRHAMTSVVKQRAPILDSVSDVYFNMVVIY